MGVSCANKVSAEISVPVTIKVSWTALLICISLIFPPPFPSHYATLLASAARRRRRRARPQGGDFDLRTPVWHRMYVEKMPLVRSRLHDRGCGHTDRVLFKGSHAINLLVKLHHVGVAIAG